MNEREARLIRDVEDLKIQVEKLWQELEKLKGSRQGEPSG